jgi:hypothetical protein
MDAFLRLLVLILAGNLVVMAFLRMLGSEH